MSSIYTSKNTVVLTVTQLNRQVADLLEGQFTQLRVSGEMSNFTQAASGHWYFTLKDNAAAVRAVMFRGKAQAVGFVPKAGERVELYARVTLYQPRGDYQLQVDSMRRAGQGNLHEAFLALKAKLEAEGLFDSGRKRVIKAVPRSVGVVTSLAAAALRDVLSCLARRAPHVRVIVYPAPVQGAQAAGQLREAIAVAGARNEVDTLLIVRGGGSLEDLWCFNDEALVRAIAACPIPTISGVGHETDFTITDFVADQRAPTPTAAAELCCVPRQDSIERVSAALQALARRQQRWFDQAALRLDRAVAMLVSPQQRLDRQNEQLQSQRLRLARAASAQLQRQLTRFEMVCSRLISREPDLAPLHRDLANLLRHLSLNAVRDLSNRRTRLLSARQTLEALSPHKILNRGYTIVRDKEGVIIKNALDLKRGDRLMLEFAQGKAAAEVTNPIQK